MGLVVSEDTNDSDKVQIFVSGVILSRLYCKAV